MSPLVVVQMLSHVWIFMTPWTAACQAPILHCLPEFAQTHDMKWMSSILCHPLLLLPPIPPSIRVFSNESTLHIRGTKFSPAPQLEASILWHSAFFMVQLSHLYMTTGKTSIALTIWPFVRKVMPLLFSRLYRFVIAFLPRIMYLLVSWLQLPSAVIFELKKIKSATVSISPRLFAMKW